MDKDSSSLLFASPFSFSCSSPFILHPLLQNLLRSFNLILILSTNPHRHLGFLHGWMVGGELSVGSFLASSTMIIIINIISIPLLHLCQLASLFPLIVSVCFVGGTYVNSTLSFNSLLIILHSDIFFTLLIPNSGSFFLSHVNFIISCKIKNSTMSLSREPSLHAVSRFGVVICWLVRNVVAFVFTWLYFLFLPFL